MIVKQSIDQSGSYLVLGSIANQSLRVRECHITWSGSVALVVGNDFHFTMLEHSNARVRCSKINADCWSLSHLLPAQTQSTNFQHRGFNHGIIRYTISTKYGFKTDVPTLVLLNVGYCVAIARHVLRNKGINSRHIRK